MTRLGPAHYSPSVHLVGFYDMGDRGYNAWLSAGQRPLLFHIAGRVWVSVWARDETMECRWAAEWER